MKNYLILTLIILGMVNCSSQSNEGIIEFKSKLIEDSVHTKFRGYTYGLTRDDEVFGIKLPDDTWVYYSLDLRNTIKVLDIQGKVEIRDTENILDEISPIVAYALEYNIYTIQSNENYMKISRFTSLNHNLQNIILCYKPIEEVMLLPEIKYYDPKIIGSRSLYYMSNPSCRC